MKIGFHEECKPDLKKGKKLLYYLFLPYKFQHFPPLFVTSQQLSSATPSRDDSIQGVLHTRTV